MKWLSEADVNTSVRCSEVHLLVVKWGRRNPTKRRNQTPWFRVTAGIANSNLNYLRADAVPLNT